MTNPPRRRASWQRRKRNPATDPTTVVRELERRRLKNLDDCRLAWEQGLDPFAICVAVTLVADAKCELPYWLAEAVLALLLDDAGSRPGLPRRLWARHRRDAEDAARAWGIAEARLESKHWDEARRVAEKRLRESAHPGVGLGTVGEEAMKRSYRLVCARLANAGRYYSPLKRPAWVHDVVLAQRRLAAEIG